MPHTPVGDLVRAQWVGHLVHIYTLAAVVSVGPSPCAWVNPGTYSTKPEHRPLHHSACKQAYEAILLSKIEHIGP